MLTLFKIKIVDFFTLFKTNHFVSPTGLGTSHNLSWRRGGGRGWRRNWGAFNFFLMEYGGLKMPKDDLGGHQVSFK